MIPLHDIQSNRYSHYPWMTITLILACVIVTIWESILASDSTARLIDVFQTFGTTPTLILNREGAGALSTVTTMFLHGGFGHLIGNMFFLWTFGRRVEDACGPWRFLLFYLTAGVMAGIAFTLIHFNDSIPGIGASGAISGVMGAYVLLYPQGRIRVMIPVFLPLPVTLKIRAYWLILYFLSWNIIPAYWIYVSSENSYSIAYWAHIGGFVSAALVLFFLRPEAYQRFINDLPV